MILGKSKLDEIFEVQIMGNNYEQLGYVQQEAKVKPTIAQTSSIVIKVTKVLKLKVNVPTPSKGTIVSMVILLILLS